MIVGSHLASHWARTLFLKEINKMIDCIWDMPDDPDGNLQHIAEHDVSVEEVEEVLNARRSRTSRSRSSKLPITFGWTSTGRYIAVIWELVEDDPRRVRAVSPGFAPTPATTATP